jgi:hypothetical protein
MKIKLTSVYVVDQEKALHFYTEMLGFVKKADFSQRRFADSRWPHQGTRTARSCSWRSTTTRRTKPTSRRCSSKASPRPCSTPTT